MTRPRLVDSKFLVNIKSKPKLNISKDAIKTSNKNFHINFPEFSVQMVISILFGIGIIYFIWSCSKMKPLDNPELDFLPENIRNNDFFGKYQPREKKKKYDKKVIKSFNQDQLEINLKTF